MIGLDVLFDETTGLEFSRLFLQWNMIKFHIIHACNIKIAPKEINLNKGVLKFPSWKLIFSTLELFKPNQNIKIDRMIAVNRANTNKTL